MLYKILYGTYHDLCRRISAHTPLNATYIRWSVCFSDMHCGEAMVHYYASGCFILYKERSHNVTKVVSVRGNALNDPKVAFTKCCALLMFSYVI